MKWLLLKLIWFYQRTLSPDHGWLRHRHPYGFCHFYPTCSQYGREAIEKYGVLTGGLKTLGRLARCHPWSRGGIDKP